MRFEQNKKEVDNLKSQVNQIAQAIVSDQGVVLGRTKVTGNEKKI